MIPNLEQYRDDETLSSLLARETARISIGSRRGFGAVLTGVERATVAVDFPVHLDRIAEQIGRRLGIGADDLIRHTTLLPLYAPFISPEIRARVMVAMKGDADARPYALLGVHRCATRHPLNLRFCPICHRVETRDLGFTWWRRTHQVAGIEGCPGHGCICDSQFRRQRHWKRDFPLADDAVECGRSAVPDEIAMSIAGGARWLLLADLPAFGVTKLRAAYFSLLRDRGYLVGDRIRRSDFLHDFFAAYGTERLRQLGLSYDPRSPYAWPAKLLIGDGECHPPLRHLHLIRFLGLEAKAFAELAAQSVPRARGRRGPDESAAEALRKMWPARSITINEMARRLTVEAATVRSWASSMGLPLPRFAAADDAPWFESVRATMRNSWQELCGGRKTSKRLRVMKWLSRNDRAWYLVHRTSSCRSGCETQVDWRRRDRELTKAIPQAVAQLCGYRPFRRLTATGIAAELGAQWLVDGADGRMPRFAASVQLVVEDQRTFMLRRIRSLREENPNLPRWRIREMASVPRPLPQDPEIRQALGYPRIDQPALT